MPTQAEEQSSAGMAGPSSTMKFQMYRFIIVLIVLSIEKWFLGILFHCFPMPKKVKLYVACTVCFPCRGSMDCFVSLAISRINIMRAAFDTFYGL